MGRIKQPFQGIDAHQSAAADLDRRYSSVVDQFVKLSLAQPARG
jgi:hypothetical protein